MSTPFDPLKAQQEVLTGLSEMGKVISALTRDAERRLAEAEAEFNALTKLHAYLRDQINEQIDQLRAIEAEVEKAKQQ